jgi:hypothetical protein
MLIFLISLFKGGRLDKKDLVGESDFGKQPGWEGWIWQ